MTEETIFDKDFDLSIQVRRRAIMPLLLKAYIVMGIVLGLVLGYLIFPTFHDVFDWFYILSAGSVIVIIGFYILKYVLLLLEVRTAIRWNWIVGGFWTVFLFAIFINAYLYYYIAGQIIVSIPYWMILYKIQRKWEHEAVSKKELLQLAKNR